MLKQQRQNIWIWNLVLEPALGRSQQPSKKVAQLRTILSQFPILGDESESVEVEIEKDLESGIRAVGNIWSICHGQPSAKQ